MTIREKVQRLIQAVADYERADLYLQFLPGAGYFKATELDAEEARVPWRDALGASRDRASAEIKAARAVLEGIDDGTDSREAIWQAGYQAAVADRSRAVRSLLEDIRRRLDEDAHDELDRLDAVSEQTQSLLRRVKALLQ